MLQALSDSDGQVEALGVLGEPTLASDGASAHLWVLDTETLNEPSTARPWLERLEPHERNRYSAYRSGAARREYLGTRALVRTALSHYSGQPAERLRFTVDRRGRPQWMSPSTPGILFSLARTSGLAVGLFTRDRNVGVDVELVVPTGVDEVAEGFFSAGELAELATLQGAARLSRFYALWTLREAYLKARGVGLTLPLDQLSFQPDGVGGALATLGPAIRDDPAHWQFGLVWLTDRHLAATCIRRPRSEAPTRIAVFDAGALVASAIRPSRD